MTPDQYFAKAKHIWKSAVPKSGQSSYVHGELLRAIEKLRDEAQRNGNINFYDGHHGVLITYLREKLADSAIFDKSIIAQLGRYLNRLDQADYPYTDDDIYDWINDRIVDWAEYYGEQVPHQPNPALPY